MSWKSLSVGSGANRRVCSGPHAAGLESFEQPLQADLHAQRAVWLAAQLEAPRWGSVQGYDGCGMSAGLLHNTALLPGGHAGPVQGSLWKLLDTMQKHPGATAAPALRALLGRLQACGWEIAPHGLLVAAGTLKAVTPSAILRELTPPDGSVAQSGTGWQRASSWALAFHEAFAEPPTRAAQVDYAGRWLAADGRGDEHRLYALFMPAGFTPAGSEFLALSAAQLPPEIELAMCIYHAFSVHNPEHARSALAAVLQRVDGSDPAKLGKALVVALANRTPRWKLKRYPRTRAALRTDAARALWPSALIDRIAPAVA
ncbi:MAG TPA: hypothetical protein VK509_12520 [Polyangiales bacterium]|nr:hypothetical protein [Polyangiales bacterium]